MKITISEDEQVLKTIELTSLQLKSIRLTGQEPKHYLSDKLQHILQFVVNEARHTIDRISPLTEPELESLIDEINAEKGSP